MPYVACLSATINGQNTVAIKNETKKRIWYFSVALIVAVLNYQPTG
jgi:hypothetical protein